MTPPSDLASTIGKLKELEAKATKGKWHSMYGGEPNLIGVLGGTHTSFIVETKKGGGHDGRDADADFIVAFRNAAPLLLACASALIEAREALKSAESTLGNQLETLVEDRGEGESYLHCQTVLRRIDALLLPFTAE